MTDSVANKNSTTRLPEELKVLLRKEQAPYLARGEEPPSFGAMLLDCWKSRSGTGAPTELGNSARSKKSALLIEFPSTDLDTKLYNCMSYIQQHGSDEERIELSEILATCADRVRKRIGDTPEAIAGRLGKEPRGTTIAANRSAERTDTRTDPKRGKRIGR